jgi:hypothetical protein
MSYEYDYTKLFDKYSTLSKLRPKDIADLFVTNNACIVGIVLYTRYKQPKAKHYEYWGFTITQPLFGDMYLCADSLTKNHWESIKLDGTLNERHAIVEKFITDYMKKYIKKNGILCIEADKDAFIKETNKFRYFFSDVDIDNDDTNEESETEVDYFDDGSVEDDIISLLNDDEVE